MKFNSQTYISLSLVIVIIGGVMWLSSMHFTVNANASGIDKITRVKDHIYLELRQIRESIGRIEGFLARQKRGENATKNP